MAINKNEITKEMLEKAMQCKTADELMAVAKSEGFEITKEETEGSHWLPLKWLVITRGSFLIM